MIPHHQLIPSLNFLTYLKSLVPDILVKHGFLITFIWYYTFCTSSCAQGEPNPQSFINGGCHEKAVNDFLRFFVFRSFIRAFFVENITFTAKQQIRDARLQVSEARPAKPQQEASPPTTERASKRPRFSGSDRACSAQSEGLLSSFAWGSVQGYVVFNSLEEYLKRLEEKEDHDNTRNH